MRPPAEIGALAAEALRVEARLTPKPGLVDAENSGAHDDMDLALLLHSADALEPTLMACAQAGADGANPEDLRDLGLRGEQAMFAATGGVNTHKGALFSLGLLCFCAAEGGSMDEICARAARIATGWQDAWLRGLADRPARTHGERAYVQHGLLGARGEAASGFETARAVGLPTLRAARQLGRRDALLVTLMSLMAANPDTNVVARGGVAALRDVRAWADAHRTDDPAHLDAAIHAADREWSRLRWSPGGSADLLAVTWFLDRLNQPLR